MSAPFSSMCVAALCLKQCGLTRFFMPAFVTHFVMVLGIVRVSCSWGCLSAAETSIQKSMKGLNAGGEINPPRALTGTGKRDTEKAENYAKLQAAGEEMKRVTPDAKEVIKCVDAFPWHQVRARGMPDDVREQYRQLNQLLSGGAVSIQESIDKIDSFGVADPRWKVAPLAKLAGLWPFPAPSSRIRDPCSEL